MNIKQLLSNVWLVSLIPFIALVFLLPVNSSRYNLRLLSTNIVDPEQYIYYDDLDNDGVSEKLVLSDYFNSSGITVSNKSGILDQWNFAGSFSFALKTGIIMTGDKDSNGIKEIYLFTLRSDSVFLHSISDLNSPVPFIKDRFVSVVGKGIKEPDPMIIPAEMPDIDSDGTKELVFAISTGISHFPRKLFAYYINRDSLVSSVETGYFIRKILEADINNDGSDEFLPWGYATCNINPENSKYHDYNSFLLAFDKNLQLLFEPVSFGGEYTALTPFVLYGEKDLLGCLYMPKETDSTSIIYKTDLKGNKKDSIALGVSACLIENVSHEQYFLQVLSGGYELYDRNFKLLRKIDFNSTGSYMITDLDGDSKDEYIINVPDQARVYVFREGLKHPASIKLTLPNDSWDILSVRKGYGTGPVLSIHAGQTQYLVEYSRNRHYFFSWLIYPGVYLAIFLFTYTLMTATRNQLRRWYENEKKVSELQLALVRNQLEPHFILNSINSIIYSVTFGEKDVAGDSLRCFSSMYRDLVLSAGESRKTIEEEIAFCKNYLSLEKMRFGDKFSYSVRVDDIVNMQKLIPKFLIQIHAENAVKHGLAPLESGGLLSIELKSEKNDLTIEIRDNGVGREKSSETDTGTTKKGLATMDELYALYNKLYNEKITSEIIDLYDGRGKPAGTTVVIRIVSQA